MIKRCTMFKPAFITLALFLFGTQAFAQKSKVQAAWRALSDYEETQRDGKPNLAYLNSAKEAIDLALNNEDTKKQTKAHAYKLRISYGFYQYKLNEQLQKLEASISDKQQRTLMAYGATDLSDFEAAANELNTIKDSDPKFLETIQKGIADGASALDEDELKFAQTVMNMKVEVANIATGKFNSKRYEEAADYFYRSGMIATIMNKAKDTASFYNACIAAAKSKNADKIIEYNKKMVELKIAAPLNFTGISNALQSKGDTLGAFDILKKGREAFPNDLSIVTEETNLFIAKGRSAEALTNLKTVVTRDPKNVYAYLFMGNIYDGMANPKDKLGKDLPKPANFDELFGNAESSYSKVIEMNPANKEFLFDANYNLGAMYNNYGGMIASRQAEKIKDLMRVQKENEEKAAVYYKKAIPYLEQALNIKNNDVNCMKALRVLYLKTGNDAKAKEMSARLGSPAQGK